MYQLGRRRSWEGFHYTEYSWINPEGKEQSILTKRSSEKKFLSIPAKKIPNPTSCV